MALKMSLTDVGNKILDIVSSNSSETRKIINNLYVHKLELSANSFIQELQKVQKYLEEKKELVETSKVLSKDSPQDIADLIELLSSSNVGNISKKDVTYNTLSKASTQYKKDLVSKVEDKVKQARYLSLLEKIELGHASSSALTEKYRSDLVDLNNLLSIVRAQEGRNPSEKSVITKSENMILSAMQQLRISLYTSSKIDKNLHSTIMGNNLQGIGIEQAIDYFNTVSSRLLNKKSFSTFLHEYLPRYVDIKSSNKTPEGFSITISFENWLDNTEKGNYSRVINSATNAVLLNIVQSGIDNTQLTRFKANLARTKKELVDGFTQLSTKVKIKIIKLASEEVSKNILDITGSPTYKELIEQVLKDALLGNKANRNIKPGKATITTKTSIAKEVRIPINGIPKITKPKPNTTKFKIPQLRNIKGQFSSTTSLEVLIRAALPPILLKNMHRPNLINRTSRFRDSIKLDSIIRSKDGSLISFLSYMKYPYGTFEEGGAQGHKGYYPTRLITESVREIARGLVKERMQVIVK